MIFLQSFLTWFYSALLGLYPHGFRNEFAQEMQTVFRDSVHEATREGILPLATLCLKEFGGLPFNAFREFWFEFKRKEMNMATNETIHTEVNNNKVTSSWDSLIGILPFALFGIACILGKLRLPFMGIYVDLIFYSIVLLGFMIGLIKGAPRWMYSYLGWSLVFAWWWSNMGTYGLRIFGFRIDHWTWQIWPPFLIVIGIALIWTRSLHPLRQMILNIWQDWTLASLMMYTFVAFVLFVYDENHHPYLLVFMAASILAICMTVWVFLQSASNWKRAIALIAGFVMTLILNNISYATWDYAAYYGLPPSPPQPWYAAAVDGIIGWTIIYSGIMYWPALIGLIRHIVNNRQKPRIA